MNELVSAEWLNQNLTKKDLILLDASLSSTAEGKSSDLQLLTIPGAHYFDLKGKFSDKSSWFPNTLPSAEQFESECRKLGINNASHIVVFDNMGVYSSPRVWWMFKAMGHDNVAVLNGGLPEWVNLGFPTAPLNKEEVYPAGDFKATLRQELVKSYEDVVANLSTGSFTIVDARSEGRFNGTAPEPRKQLKSGHIAGSVNIPYGDVLENGKFRSVEELKALFENKATDDKELVYSCGSGLTACIVMLAGELAHQNNKAIYDGSWTEWAELQHLKVEEE